MEVVAQSLLSPRDVDLCRGRLDFRLMLETKARLELESKLQVTRKDWGTRYDQLVALYAREKKAHEETLALVLLCYHDPRPSRKM
nr:hypothetical protein Iba_chr13fCG6790 [Ipomoea batatas]